MAHAHFMMDTAGAHTRTSLARESASGSLTREAGSDIYVYIIDQSPARDTTHGRV
jgi:hypothetical protein